MQCTLNTRHFIFSFIDNGLLSSRALEVKASTLILHNCFSFCNWCVACMVLTTDCDYVFGSHMGEKREEQEDEDPL